MEKNEIRNMMLQKRKNLTEEEQDRRSAGIAEFVLQSEQYRMCRNLCVYHAFRGEVSCAAVIRQAYRDSKGVYVPVTDEERREMQFYRITEHTRWTPGAYGIMEPVTDRGAARLSDSALVLMPGLVFDKQHHRLGYGGGYYDKYLAAHKDCVTMALCYDFQIVEWELPCESHDILPDFIVTDSGIL